MSYANKVRAALHDSKAVMRHRVRAADVGREADAEIAALKAQQTHWEEAADLKVKRRDEEIATLRAELEAVKGRCGELEAFVESVSCRTQDPDLYDRARALMEKSDG